jgi:3-oxoacyl-[acyl-carrier protein] reductase
MSSVIGTYCDLAGKTVVVTGGSRGIGARTAREFAAQRANVCVVGRDADALAGIVEEIVAKGGRAMAVVADITDAGALADVQTRVTETFGDVDVLAAFAGGQGAPTPSLTMPEARWHQIIDSEVTSALLAVQAFAPGMAERGAGSILLMSSSAGRRPSQANIAYGVAKAGVVMLTRQLATELGPSGVRVNCLAPSTIHTEKVAAQMPEAVQQKVAAAHPLGRIGTTGDVAAAALFLASDAASFLTGLTIDVAGGRIMD